VKLVQIRGHGGMFVAAVSPFDVASVRPTAGYAGGQLPTSWPELQVSLRNGQAITAYFNHTGDGQSARDAEVARICQEIDAALAAHYAAGGKVFSE
jgi:hypothetical protein